MTISENVMQAVLAMDAYNRDYDAGITLVGTNVGAYSIGVNSLTLGHDLFDNRRDENIGFFAQAYERDGETVISHRGTDGALDGVYGWPTGAGEPATGQNIMALEFYRAIAGSTDPRYADISLTGHSMGAGFAGFVGAAFLKEGVLFDNMEFEDAIANIGDWITPGGNYSPELLAQLYGSSSPWSPSVSGLEGFYVNGEALSSPYVPGNHGSQSIPETEISLGYDPTSDLSAIDLHSISTLILAMYGGELSNADWEHAAEYLWPALYDDAFAHTLGVEAIEGQLKQNSRWSDILRSTIAYSAIGESDGATVFGDSGIVALFDDATDLGAVLKQSTHSEYAEFYAEDITKVLVEYAGLLATSKVLQSSEAEAADGVLSIQGTNDETLVLDFSNDLWDSALGNRTSIVSRDALVQLILSDTTYQGAFTAAMHHGWGDAAASTIGRIVLATEETSSLSNLSHLGTIGQGTMILGSITDDVISGTAGNDIVLGGIGNDTITSSGGADILDGGADIDTLDFSSSTESLEVAILGPQTGEITTSSGTVSNVFNFEEVILSDENDFVVTNDSSGVDDWYGLDGNDTFLLMDPGYADYDIYGGNGYDEVNLVNTGNLTYTLSTSGNVTTITAANGYPTSITLHDVEDVNIGKSQAPYVFSDTSPLGYNYIDGYIQPQPTIPSGWRDFEVSFGSRAAASSSLAGGEGGAHNSSSSEINISTGQVFATATATPLPDPNTSGHLPIGSVSSFADRVTFNNPGADIGDQVEITIRVSQTYGGSEAVDDLGNKIGMGFNYNLALLNAAPYWGIGGDPVFPTETDIIDFNYWHVDNFPVPLGETDIEEYTVIIAGPSVTVDFLFAVLSGAGSPYQITNIDCYGLVELDVELAPGMTMTSASGLLLTQSTQSYSPVLIGSAGEENYVGTYLDETMYGQGGDDTLTGGEGDDTLVGGDGEDTIYGGADADTFLFSADNPYGNPDQIQDFSLTDGDKLDVRALLSFYHATDDITDFVQITTSGSDSILKIDADGGGNNFVQIATLYSITGLTDEADLVADGTLIVGVQMISGLFASHYLVDGGTSALTQIDFAATPLHTEVVASIDQPNNSAYPFFTGGPTDNFAVSYEGYLNVVTAGTYAFDLTSDDGSALWLDGELLIGNDGLHGAETQSASIALSAGLHTLETHYFEAGWDQNVQLSWSGADTGNVMEIVDGTALQNNGAGVNIKPVTADDFATTDVNVAVNINVLENDADDDGDELEVTAVTQGSHGTVVINIDGTIGYTPSTSYTGQDSFTYTVNDGHGGTSLAQVDITIGFGTPGLFASHYIVGNNTSSLTQIDFSATPVHTEVVTSIDQPQSSAYPFYTDGPTDFFAVSYEGYLNVVTAGTYTFDLTSDDGSALWLDGELLIGNDGLHGPETESASISLSAGLHTLETHYFELGWDQTVQLSWSGADTGNVMEVIGGSALTNIGANVNIKPVTADDITVTDINTAVNIDALANDEDDDGNELEVIAITQGSHGTVVINTNGTIGYTPTTSYTGQDSFTYTVSDGHGGTSIAQVDVTIGSGAIYGTSGNNSINGGAGNDTIYGLAGNDTITGNAGQDELHGGEGDDTYVFASGFGAATTLGPDIVHEGTDEGDDEIDLSYLGFNDVHMWVDDSYNLHIRSTSENDDEIVVEGDAAIGGGTDVIDRVESILFSGGSHSMSDSLFLQDSEDGHTIYGSAGGDLINAQGGNDTLYGFDGNDILFGNGGTDEAHGGDGDDLLFCSGDGDDFYGDDGADTFKFISASAGTDTIHDFSVANDDKIDLSDVLQGYDPLTDAITDWVEFTTSGADSILKVDADGGANNFVQIAVLNGVTGLTDEGALLTGGHLIAA